MKFNSISILFTIVISVGFLNTNKLLGQDKSDKPNNIEIKVFDIGQDIPPSAKVLIEKYFSGEVFTEHCTYEDQIEKAKSEAIKKGGNAIKIIDYAPPSSITNSCHKITVKILYIPNIETVDSIDTAKVQSDVDYATLFIYRTPIYGGVVSYNLYLGDSLLCRVYARTKKRIKVYVRGEYVLWAKTEEKTELPINIQPGKEYFINCGISYGLYVGRPLLQHVDRSEGEQQYHGFKGKDERKDAIYKTDGKVLYEEITSEDQDYVYFFIRQKGKYIKSRLDKSEISKIDYAE